MKEFRFTQGVNFNAYDELNNQRVRLANVEKETIVHLKRDDYVQIDFDGDNKMIWNGIVTTKNAKNNTVVIYLP